MNPIRRITCIALMLCAVAPMAGSAQRVGQITFFSQIGFRGLSFTVSGPSETVRVPFRVRSAQLAQGDMWEVCPQARYRGNCNVISTSQGNVAWTVNSVRPVSPAVTLPEPIPGVGQSLRGMTAEFFPRPSDTSGRVVSCTQGTAACAAQAADRFCRSRGWTASAYERQETVAGRNLLTDVLCTRMQTR